MLQFLGERPRAVSSYVSRSIGHDVIHPEPCGTTKDGPDLRPDLLHACSMLTVEQRMAPTHGPDLLHAYATQAHT